MSSMVHRFFRLECSFSDIDSSLNSGWLLVAEPVLSVDHTYNLTMVASWSGFVMMEIFLHFSNPFLGATISEKRRDDSRVEFGKRKRRRSSGIATKLF